MNNAKKPHSKVPENRSVMLRLPAKDAMDPVAIERALKQQVDQVDDWVVLRRSLDARRHPAVMELKVGLDMTELPVVHGNWQSVEGAPVVAIVGAGPAGLYCALRLIERGIRPIV